MNYQQYNTRLLQLRARGEHDRLRYRLLDQRPALQIVYPGLQHLCLFRAAVPHHLQLLLHHPGGRSTREEHARTSKKDERCFLTIGRESEHQRRMQIGEGKLLTLNPFILTYICDKK